MQFANESLLWFLLLIPCIIAWYIFKSKHSQANLQVSTLAGMIGHSKTWRVYLRHFPFAFRIAALSLLILVLARPQSTSSWENVSTEGIDIILALDISGSMLAEDFKPNRLEASIDVAMEFIAGRPDDRMGLVVFSGESFTQCPLTTDHAVLMNLFQDIKSGMIEDGTAIGLGLANAVSRLEESSAESKVVILLTDGVNNQGEIAPLTAAEIAKTFGVRVYTVGVGTLGTAPYPVRTAFGVQYQNVPVQIDEDVLREIARMTDGQYFRATNNAKLKDIYNEIDQLEKSKIEVREISRKTEEFFWWALLAGLFLIAELLLRLTIFRSNP
ncbi:MAG: VWA domain-containing protein [Bacteroidetes bacterium]|nr:VWA domain-containing protein [Bacteroidota bacterium]MBT4401644.1 VWA domain-containing protein [Bacteroidota bacterium]MBT5425972.1 VWA domain-containing protein [Bacteroidota bacterium]MBT7095609.1 VWA domain-containing protein [Bacteroidota bacterium]MBT7464663.1 VWA domain-containing protein [Bacteroidota bacterium]